MDFRTLFSVTEGRITRSTWWIGVVLLEIAFVLLVAMPTGLVITDTLGQEEMAFVGIRGYLGVITIVALYSLAYPVIAKRFHDRNKSGQLALLGVIPFAVLEIGLYLGIISVAPENNNFLEELLVIYCIGTKLWFVVDLGVLKGTLGQNRFGEYPESQLRDFRLLEAAKVIGGHVLAFYARAAAAVGIVFTQAAISRLVSLPLFLLALFPNFAQGYNPMSDILPSTLYTVITVILEMICVTAGFLIGTPITRLALRFWPITPFEIAPGRERAILIASALSIALATVFVGLTFLGAFNASKMLGTPNEYSWQSGQTYLNFSTQRGQRQISWDTELSNYGSRLVLASMFLGAISAFFATHRKFARDINVPFALFLRRFSSFGDRSLITDVMKSMPADMPLVFVASRSDQARNWDPFLWSFGGLRLWKPWRNLPIQIKTTDAEWQQTVERLLGRAHCVIIDVSEESPGVAIEREMIERFAKKQHVIALKSTSSSPRLGPVLSSCNVVDYSSSFLYGAFPSAFKVAFILSILSQNSQNFYVWPAIFILPFLVMPSITRQNRRMISEAITAASGSHLNYTSGR